MKRVTKRDCYLARVMHDAGRSTKEIAERRGLSVATVRRITDMGFNLEMYQAYVKAINRRSRIDRERRQMSFWEKLRCLVQKA